jgi:hypothetical protein
MKNSAVILVVVAISVWAQAQDSAQGPDESVTACPMMGMTSPMQEEGGERKMMGRMAGMFSLSREEIAALLTEHNQTLQLSDAQVQQIAERIEASQGEKTEKSMKAMMERMQAGARQCGCMEAKANR